MAIDLLTLPEATSLPVGVTIERVETRGALQDWLRAFSLGFRVSEDRLADYSAMPLGIPPAESAFRYYLARVGEEPAATAMLYPARQVAVIEEVSVVPATRGRAKCRSGGRHPVPRALVRGGTRRAGGLGM